MKIEVIKVSESDQDIIANLMQLYQYDFTDYNGEPVGERGSFSYKYLDHYWQENDRHPFLICYEGEIAGFCMVNKHSLLGNNDIFSMAEFFILRYMRGKGIGREAAKSVFELFPGQWEVSQTYQNVDSQKFWLKCMESLVGEDFQKVDLEEEEKVVLTFTYPGPER